MVLKNLLVLVSVVTLSALPVLLALPITSKPFARSPDHLAWDALNRDAYDPLDPTADGYEKPKKILPKSIFIAPTLQNSVTTCGPGYTTDHRGNCIQTIQINHNQLLLNQLNHLLANHQHQLQQHQTEQQPDEDIYDYDYESETATLPVTKDTQKGPFQLTLPVQLESDPETPQALTSTDPIDRSSLVTTSSTSTAKPTPTTKRPFDTLTSVLEGLFPINKNPFQLAPQLTAVRTTTAKIEVLSTTTEAAEETTTMISETDVETTTNADTGVTVPFEPETLSSSADKDVEWGTSEFASELANEQLVPVTSTTTWDSTTSDADLLLSNAEGTTTYEVATEARDYTSSNGAISTSPATISTSTVSTTLTEPTTTRRPEVTETVLPLQVSERKPFPTISTLFSPSSGIFDWRLRSPISIVTPVPNPFPFTRTTFGNGGSLFKFTVPVTTTPQTTSTTSTTTEAPPQVPEVLLAVENESENSQRLRESLIESEQKELNYENIDVNNRFIYHHLNGMPTTTVADQQNVQTTSTLTPLQPIVVEEELRILTEGDRDPEKLLTPSPFSEKLADNLRTQESDNGRLPSSSPLTLWSSSSQVTTTPIHTTTEGRRTPSLLPSVSTATGSRFEEFLRASSNRIRFPGPSVDRLPAPNKLIPKVTSRSGLGSDKEKKPFWWFPSGWEVDTKQKEKPVLLRFWTKMPLIPDSVASQRRSNNNNSNSRNNRENSKSPSDNLYREVAFQDISRAFQERRHSSGGSS